MRRLAFLLAPFARRKVAAFGLCFLALVLAAALLAPWVAPYDPLEMDALGRLARPGAEHWFGTDRTR